MERAGNLEAAGLGWLLIVLQQRQQTAELQVRFQDTARFLGFEDNYTVATGPVSLNVFIHHHIRADEKQTSGTQLAHDGEDIGYDLISERTKLGAVLIGKALLEFYHAIQFVLDLFW